MPNKVRYRTHSWNGGDFVRSQKNSIFPPIAFCHTRWCGCVKRQGIWSVFLTCFETIELFFFVAHLLDAFIYFVNIHDMEYEILHFHHQFIQTITSVHPLFQHYCQLCKIFNVHIQRKWRRMYEYDTTSILCALKALKSCPGTSNPMCHFSLFLAHISDPRYRLQLGCIGLRYGIRVIRPQLKLLVW